MINSSVIISGEASETDSDDDTAANAARNTMTTSIQGEVITGEDSESDDENGGSISSAASALTVPDKDADNSETSNGDLNRNESLLHKKLRECNGHLYNDIELFCQNMVCQAGKNLSAIDQQLLKSQITLQSAVSSLRSLNVNSALLKDKLHSILSSKFISNIKTNCQ